MDFKVNNVEVGNNDSEVRLDKPQKVKVTANIAALLSKEKDSAVQPLDLNENIWALKPFWNLERSRIGNSREVTVELIVNGKVAAQKTITADGIIRNIEFETEITHSSWIAMRILYASHTNPIFVIVDNKPIRASKKSAEWCLQAVDICWKQKQVKITEDEKEAALQDYQWAQKYYQKISSESNQ